MKIWISHSMNNPNKSFPHPTSSQFSWDPLQVKQASHIQDTPKFHVILDSWYGKGQTNKVSLGLSHSSKPSCSSWLVVLLEFWKSWEKKEKVSNKRVWELLTSTQKLYFMLKRINPSFSISSCTYLRSPILPNL